MHDNKKKQKKKNARPALFENFMLLQYNYFFFPKLIFVYISTELCEKKSKLRSQVVIVRFLMSCGFWILENEKKRKLS